MENLEDLRTIRLRVPTDIIAGHWRTCEITSCGVSNQRGNIANEEDDRVAQILKMLHLTQQHGVAEVEIGCGGIEARLDSQWLSILCRLYKTFSQVFLADDFRE